MLFALNLSSLMPTRPPWRHISTPFSKPRLPLLLHFHLDGGEGGFPQSPPDPPPLSPLGPPAGDVSLQCQQTILPRLQRTLGRVILLLPLDPMPEAMSLRLPAALPPPPPPPSPLPMATLCKFVTVAGERLVTVSPPQMRPILMVHGNWSGHQHCTLFLACPLH